MKDAHQTCARRQLKRPPTWLEVVGSENWDPQSAESPIQFQLRRLPSFLREIRAGCRHGEGSMWWRLAETSYRPPSSLQD